MVHNHIRWFAVGSLGVTLVLVHRIATAEDDAKRQMYVQYCGSCHGPAGKGDGILAGVLTEKPADLTQIAKKNGGQFPSQKIVQYIDGTSSVRAHGDPDMPVWGEVFREQASWSTDRRTQAQSKIMFITEYLRSIQEK